MKYSKNAAHAYEANGISTENGWIKWYEKEKTSKKLRVTGTWAQCILVVAMINISRNYSEEIRAFGILKIIGLLAANALILLAVVAPLREILHLIPLSKGRLDGKCVMSFRRHFSVYNGTVSRTQILLSLALPVLVFALAFGIAVALTSGITRFLAGFLLAEACFVCYSDIYMIVFCLRNIGSDESVFGEFKR